MKKYWFCCLLCCLTWATYAQLNTDRFMAYGPESQYLSGINARVYQSRSGYLWICSSNGLIRFDGKRYSIFSADYSNPQSLTDNIVVDVAEDKYNNLWIAGFTRGVTRYNQRTGKFKKYPALCNDGNPIFGINKILNDAEQTLWFATAGRGIARYDFGIDSFHFFYPEPLAAKDGTVRGDNFVTDIVEDPFDKEILWVGSFHGLFLFHKNRGTFTRFECISKNPKEDILINDLEMLPNGQLWMGTWGNGLQCFNSKAKKFETNASRQFKSIIYDIKYAGNSTLYAACLGQGLYKYTIGNKDATQIGPITYPANSINGNDIQRISTTPNAGIFAGGKNHIYQFHPYYNRLQKNFSFAHADSTYFSLVSVKWDNYRNQYWVCTYEHIYELTPNLSIKKIHSPYTSWANGPILLNLVKDNSHNVWAHYSQKGLLHYSDQTKTFLPTTSIPLHDSLLKNIKSITVDAKGNLCFFTANNLYRYNATDSIITSVPLQWDKAFTGQQKLVDIHLVAAPNNEVWLLSQQGIFIFNEKQFVKHIYKTGEGKNQLSNRFVMMGDFNAAAHSFWLSSGDGLQVMDTKDYAILSTHFLTQGLPANTLRGIAIDSMGRVWIASAAGVGYFNPVVKIWRNFNRVDGLMNDHIDGKIFMLSNGKVAVPQKGGLSLYADSVFLTKDTCRLRITSILVNNKIYTDSVLPEFVTSLSLPYHQNNIIIEYAAMDWVYPLKTNYRYKIEGVKGLDTWLPNEEAKLNLSGLQPGTYKLHLRALNNGGYWSNEVVLPITIRAPFWRTGWFYALLILGIAIVLFLLFKYRINQLKKLQRMRNKISRDLHDDIGASLSNINILNELARRNINEHKERSTEYLNRASEDIQQISENLSDIVWNINPIFDNISNLFIRMKRYAAEMADGKNILCQFDMPEAANCNLSMDKRRDFYLLYKEAINNLVKHSRAKNAFIKILLSGSSLQMVIKDDGIGFSKEHLKEGNGLHNMNQRAEHLKGVLQIESAPGKGTVLQFTMPV